MTHYYFDDCIYYTPAFSDEYLGRLALRNIVSIADGTPKPNLYLNEEILPPPVPRLLPPSGVPDGFTKWIARAWRRRRGLSV